MTARDGSDDEVRRLRAELLRCGEDLALTRERLRYATGEIAALRKKIPTTVTQAAAPGTVRGEDPLERLFRALRPRA